MAIKPQSFLATSSIDHKPNRCKVVIGTNHSMFLYDQDATSVSEMNVSALHSFHNGDGKTATITLFRAIQTLLQGPTTAAHFGGSTSSCPDKNDGPLSVSSEHHTGCIHRVSTVQYMTVATSSEDTSRLSAFQGRWKHRLTRQVVSKFDQKSMDISSSCDLFMYCKPFLIVNSDTAHRVNVKSAATVTWDKNCIPEIMAALLFNLGLMHHVAGTKKNGNCGSSSLLKKALLCYDEAIHYIRHCTTKVAVLVAAICNNRMHLYHHYFYDSIKGREQLKLMDHALTYIEYAFIPRKVECDRRSGKCSLAACVLTDPRKVTQSISGHDLHRFRLTYAFTKMHDFRLSPAA